jgi:glutaredoxin
VNHRITFYTRKRCCLCDTAKEVIERVRSEQKFELLIVDLDREASPDKRAAYTNEVPVVELDGRKIMKYEVDEARLTRLLSL